MKRELRGLICIAHLYGYATTGGEQRACLPDAHRLAAVLAIQRDQRGTQNGFINGGLRAKANFAGNTL